jgi:hypothetical protein
MKNKELLDLMSPAAEERRQWQSFLGLLPILDVTPVDPVLYQRCLAAVWRVRAGGLISRIDLRRNAGFDHGGETLHLELAIARLVRERVIEPIVATPFSFQIQRRNSTNPESAYAGDRPEALAGITREEQTARFRILQSLTAAIVNGRLPEKREQRVRRERDELEQIYEATWLELEDAIGRRSAMAIRRSVERACGPGTQQLELSLEENRGPGWESEETCNQ